MTMTKMMGAVVSERVVISSLVYISSSSLPFGVAPLGLGLYGCNSFFGHCPLSIVESQNLGQKGAALRYHKRPVCTGTGAVFWTKSGKMG